MLSFAFWQVLSYFAGSAMLNLQTPSLVISILSAERIEVTDFFLSGHHCFLCSYRFPLVFFYRHHPWVSRLGADLNRILHRNCWPRETPAALLFFPSLYYQSYPHELSHSNCINTYCSCLDLSSVHCLDCRREDRCLSDPHTISTCNNSCGPTDCICSSVQTLTTAHSPSHIWLWWCLWLTLIRAESMSLAISMDRFIDCSCQWGWDKHLKQQVLICTQIPTEFEKHHLNSVPRQYVNFQCGQIYTVRAFNCKCSSFLLLVIGELSDKQFHKSLCWVHVVSSNHTNRLWSPFENS